MEFRKILLSDLEQGSGFNKITRVKNWKLTDWTIERNPKFRQKQSTV